MTLDEFEHVGKWVDAQDVVAEGEVGEGAERDLELAEGVSVEGVRIVYGRNSTTLHVTVRGAAGRRPPEEFFVALVPADLSAWSPNTQPFFCMTGEAGTCPVSAPPARIGT